jgi:hypothetical protein
MKCKLKKSSESVDIVEKLRQKRNKHFSTVTKESVQKVMAAILKENSKTNQTRIII